MGNGWEPIGSSCSRLEDAIDSCSGQMICVIAPSREGLYQRCLVLEKGSSSFSYVWMLAAYRPMLARQNGFYLEGPCSCRIEQKRHATNLIAESIVRHSSPRQRMAVCSQGPSNRQYSMYICAIVCMPLLNYSELGKSVVSNQRYGKYLASLRLEQTRDADFRLS